MEDAPRPIARFNPAVNLLMLLVLAVFNAFLAHATQEIAETFTQTFERFGFNLSRVTELALKLPVWFNLVSAVAAVLGLLHFQYQFGTNKIVFVLVAFFILDTCLLLAMLWGMSIVFIPIGGKLPG